MNNRTDIQRELEQTGSRLPFNVRMPVFDLPQDYFENFPAAVLAKVKETAAADAQEELAGLSPLLAGMPRRNPYTVPQDYFKETLAPRELGEEDLVPGWDAVGKTVPYSVPAGYFSQLPAALLQKVAPRQAKVVPLFGRRWVQYAAAAMFAGALVLGGLLFQNRNGEGSPEAEAWVAKKLQGVSNQELEAFILTTEVTGLETVQQAGNNKTEVRKLLKDVPSDELDAFLNQLPSGTEQIN